MARWLRVAVVAVGLVVLAGTVGCGDDGGDESGDVAAGADTTPTSLDGGGSGLKPAPQGGEPSLVGPISQVSAREQTLECDESDPSASPDDAVSSDDDVAAGCGKQVGVLGSFVVDDGVDPDGAALAANVSVPSDIAILREDGQGGWALASFEDLAEGTTVQVWFQGPVAESYPVQATAGSIVIEA